MSTEPNDPDRRADASVEGERALTWNELMDRMFDEYGQARPGASDKSWVMSGYDNGVAVFAESDDDPFGPGDTEADEDVDPGWVPGQISEEDRRRMAERFGEDSGFMFLRVDDPRVDGYQKPKPPLGLTKQARVRRKMAQMLADDLADPPYRQEGGGHDWAHAAMEVPATYSPVARVLSEAEAVTETAIAVPGETWLATGYQLGNDLVVRVHGPSWSLVFTTYGSIGTVYVCSDDVPEVPLKVKQSDAAAATEVNVMAMRVLWQLQRIAPGGDKAGSFLPAAG